MSAYNDLFIRIENARTLKEFNSLSDEIARLCPDEISFTEQLLLQEELTHKRLLTFAERA